MSMKSIKENKYSPSYFQGDYYGEISIKDKATGKTIFCFNADVHLKQAPTVSAGPVGR